ncbi:MAG TPA: SGNH/GDSL hydrolase family protein [Rhizomicrobium sp.]|jgi:lysophospholipase L1-like esterase
MQSISLKDVATLFDGHASCLTGADRVQPLRYRIADAPFLDAGVKLVGSFAGGVRLRLKTDSRTLRLDVAQVQAHVPGREWWSTDYEILIDGKPWRNVSAVGGARVAQGGAMTGDPQAVLTLEDLPPGEKQMELWLPHAATTAVTGMQIDDAAHWEPWPDMRWRVLFHGSSITQAVDANAGTLTWPGVAATKANVSHVNLGWGGSCLISGFAARILRDEPADAIVLELGANVWENGLLKERTFTDSTQSMLSIIREKHADTPIAVVSPITFKRGDEASNDGGISIGRMRELLEAVVAARVAGGDGNVHYLSGALLSGPEDLDDLPDGVHPDAKGNRKMGERFFDHMLAPGKPLASR